MRRGAWRLAPLALAGVAAALLWLAGCAPHAVAPPRLDLGPRRARFEAALAARRSRPACDAQVSAWASGEALRDLPGVQARLVLLAPDGFRLRVGSLFGTALDLAARGDSLTAYAPASRMALRTAAAGESLGFGDPGGIGYRVWAAAWQPPESAWNDPQWSDSLLVLGWTESGDSLRLAIGSNGLPSGIEVLADGATRVRGSYSVWSDVAGIAWPTTLRVEDANQRYVLRCKLDHVRFSSSADAGRLAIDVPDDAQTVTRAQLARALKKLGRL